MNKIQDEIDVLRRQKLTLDLVACVLRNQLYGPPDAKEKKLQENLLIALFSEVGHLEEAINHLVNRRDNLMENRRQ